MLEKLRRPYGSGTGAQEKRPVTPATTQNSQDVERDSSKHADNEPVRWMTFRVFLMAVIVSIGGLIFGYDTGQISGFLEMPNFLFLFADKRDGDKLRFGNVRSGAIVALLSIGTLMGSLLAAPVADYLGRKRTIIVWNLVFCVGVIVQVATINKWYQIAIGRWVAGLGVGGLSVLTPMYQSETAPRQVRGALVSCYQLFITLGIFVACCINFGTEADPSRRSWRLPMAIGFIWPVIMIAGMMFLPESPRYDFRRGKIDRARRTIAKSYGVSESHREVVREMREIREKFEAESVGGKQKAYEIFTGPRMLYRVILGVALQMFQQLTGANYFFYYHANLLGNRTQKQLRHEHDSRWRQLRHDLLRSLHCRAFRSSSIPHRWRRLDVHVFHGLCLDWPLFT